MKPSLRRLRPAHGFTLVEAVVEIVIIGIIGAIIAVFIRAPILGYRDTADRAELTDQADLALRRMARDIRLALPNSVRVTTTANGDVLEFLQTKSGGRYISADDGLPDASWPLSFDNPGKLDFAALAPSDNFVSLVRAGDYVVVYNLGEDFAPANAYKLPVTANPCAAAPAGGISPSAGNIARIQAFATEDVAIGTGTGKVRIARLTLAGNPFACQDLPLQSPEFRFQVVSGPVSYYCEPQADGTSILWRASGYPIAAAQPVPTAAPVRAMVASRLRNCTGLFRYGDNASASRRAGLVVITIALRSRIDANASIRLVHQVHVDNTP
jgi:MSHA biogenesis protein MshO